MRFSHLGSAMLGASFLALSGNAFGVVNYAISPTTLDLFRFANNVPGYDPSTNLEFRDFARNLIPGEPAIFDDISVEYQMSTGLPGGMFGGGDGRQASHWRDDVLTLGSPIGTIDPTLASGGTPGFPSVTPVMASDIRAMDLIGYDAGPNFTGASPMQIVISPGSGLSGNAPALAAFQRAAAQWTSVLHDPITINISANLTGGFPSSSIIGSTGSVLIGLDYDPVRNAMIADGTDAIDNDTILNFLPTLSEFTAVVPDDPSVAFSLTGDILLSKANLKAIGVAGGLTQSQIDTAFGLNDATIVFNNQFLFDYDNTDGVTAGYVDFETVAAHEIGHALGFFSIVDEINAIPEPASLAVLSVVTCGLIRRRRAGR